MADAPIRRNLSAPSLEVLEKAPGPVEILKQLLADIRSLPECDAETRGELKDMLVEGQYQRVTKLLAFLQRSSRTGGGPSSSPDHTPQPDLASGAGGGAGAGAGAGAGGATGAGGAADAGLPDGSAGTSGAEVPGHVSSGPGFESSWKCAACHLSNASSRQTCSGCDNPAPPKTDLTEGGMTAVQVEEEAGLWDCPCCSLLNAGSRIRCSTCMYLRTEDSSGAVLEEDADTTSRSVNVAPIPPEFILRGTLGSVPLGDSGVLFRVWAPNATAVYVAGDFNDWSSWREYPLIKEDPDASLSGSGETPAGFDASDAVSAASGGGGRTPAPPSTDRRGIDDFYGGCSVAERTATSDSPATDAPGAGGTAGEAPPTPLPHITFSGAVSASHARGLSGYFSGILPAARAGQHYQYVVIGGSNGRTVLWRNDPCARALAVVEDNVRRSLIVDRWGFQWTDSEFTAPAREEMILYELHPGSFSPEGTWDGAAKRLDYLSRLGVNTIAVLPPTQDAHDQTWGEHLCWGYDPLTLFACHRGYGSPDDLKRFINAAHMFNMAVIIDWVPNHMGSQTYLRFFDGRKAAPGFEIPDSTQDGGSDEAAAQQLGPYFYPDTQRRETPYGPRLDCRVPQVRHWLITSAVMWLEEYHFDGVRVDSTQTLRRLDSGAFDSPNDFTADAPEAWSFMQEFTSVLRARFPDAFLIAEDLAGTDTLNTIAGFDSQWDPNFFYPVYRAVVTDWDENRHLDTIERAICSSYTGCVFDRIIFTESHDTAPEDRSKRVPKAISAAGGPFAVKRTILAAALMFSAVGVPMMLQGQELLEMDGETWPAPPPLHHGSFNAVQQATFSMFQLLLRLRANEWDCTQGLTGNFIRVTHCNHHGKVLAFRRFVFGGPGDDVVVIVNFSSSTFRHYEIGMPRGGVWHVRFNSDICPLTDDQIVDDHERETLSAAFTNVDAANVDPEASDGSDSEAKHDGAHEPGAAPTIVAVPGVYDCSPFRASVALGPYAVVMLSQEPVTGHAVLRRKVRSPGRRAPGSVDPDLTGRLPFIIEKGWSGALDAAVSLEMD